MRSRIYAVALLLLTLSSVLLAAEQASVINTEVTVVNRDDESEQSAFEASLVQALETMTHNENIGKSPEAARLKKSARDYLLEFQYEENADEGWLLHSQFDANALANALKKDEKGVDKLMKDEVLFWLVYQRNDRAGKILSRLGNEKLVQRVRKAADAAGIKAVFPLYDLRDKALVTADDLVSGYVEGVEKATGRYHVAQYLTGIMAREGKVWRVQLEQFGVVAQAESPSSTRALRLALAQLRADTAEIASQTAVATSIRIAVAYVKSYSDYKKLSRYLESMPGIASVKTVSNSGDVAVFDIVLKETDGAWLKALEEDDVLSRSSGEIPGVSAADYQFQMISGG